MWFECPHCRASLPAPTSDELVACTSCEVEVLPRLREDAAETRDPGVGARGQPVPVRRTGFEPDGSERWYVRMGDESCGPFDAGELADRLDTGTVAWTTSVWREGLKGWRPARRDPVLVTSIAAEHGFDTDTVRVASPSSDVSQETETHADPAPPDRETTPLWGRTERIPESARSFADVERSPVLPKSTLPPGPISSPAMELRLAGLRLRIPHTVLSVAAVAFATGVLAAVLWARVLGRGEWTPSISAAAPTQAQSPGPAAARVVKAPAASQPGWASARPLSGEPGEAPTLPGRDLPKTQEVRQALAALAPQVRGCLRRPKRGADVVVILEGPSGRLQEVHVERPTLDPARLECVRSALGGLRIEPFRRAELVYPYTFAD